MAPTTLSQTIDDITRKCSELAKIRDNDTHELAAMMLDISTNYYVSALIQSNKSFNWALVMAITGIALFFTALCLMMANLVQFGYLSLIGSILPQIISGIMFYLYSQTSKQLFAFQVCLERTKRHLISNTICGSLVEGKDEMRRELVRIIATAPVLSRALVEHGESCKKAGHASSDKGGKQKSAAAGETRVNGKPEFVPAGLG